MMFFNKGKTPSDPSKPAKKRSLFGLLFVPQLGPSIRPIGGAFSSLVNIIASVFAMNGLFPKDHPALNGDANARLSLSSVLSTAWNGLSFTPEGMPKVLLFFAVSAGVALVFLSVVTALLLGFTSSAHADSFFTPGTSDMASNWIDLLFNIDRYADARTEISKVVGEYSLPSSNIQAALTSALSMYSNAMLMIAAIMLFYYLTAMVVETAHHGEPMGKRANKIWAPIRLVVAVGLLVPVSDGGLNSGQYIVLKVAKMGCGLASTIWARFVDALVDDMKNSGGGAALAGDPLSSVSAFQETKTVAYNMLMMYACQHVYNYFVYEADRGFNGVITFNSDYINGRGTWSPNINLSGYEGQTAPKKYSFKNGIISDYDVCGSYSIAEQPKPSESVLDETFSTAYKQVVNSFNTALEVASDRSVYVARHMTLDPSVASPGSLPSSYPTPDDVAAVAAELRAGLGVASAGISASSAIANLADKIGAQSKDMGWVAAGSWFNSLVRMQADISGLIEQSLPVTSPPQIGKEGGPGDDNYEGWFKLDRKSNAAKSHYDRTQEVLRKYSSTITKGEPGVASQALSGSITNNTADPRPTSGACDSPIGCVFAAVGYIADMNGIWQQNVAVGGENGDALSKQGIGVQFHGKNPLMEMSAWGHKCINAAFTLFNVAGVISAVTSPLGKIATLLTTAAGAVTAPITGGAGIIVALLGTAVMVIGGAIASGLVVMGSVFFGMGVTLGYVVPLFPFMHFFFNIITWIACVAEALIAVPMIALAHLNPEGDGISGKAHSAYEMIFSIFLRPVMMIFGLICCLLVMYVAVGLLNAVFASAVSGASISGGGGAHIALGRIMYSIIYVTIIYSVANHATALIARFPNQAVTWAGWKPAGTEAMGNPSDIAKVVGISAGYLGQQTGQAINSAGAAAGNAMSGGMEKMHKNKMDKLSKDSREAGRTGGDKPQVGMLAGAFGGNNHVDAGYSEGVMAGEQEMFGRVEMAASERGMTVGEYVHSNVDEIRAEMADITGSVHTNPDMFMGNYMARRSNPTRGGSA